ncbi:Dipeptidase 1 [Ceratocystis fimbriata CBS 114723]|uniref:Dipeptidase n=1 Tax=Ceratocystis fimbriata CBS 114723 TaxID=1035309 RepID=A0A2C5X549_9PEZI|nr:Dipeptidase 1 [Ceratocystis fimbriata CBS 114723]
MSSQPLLNAAPSGQLLSTTKPRSRLKCGLPKGFKTLVATAIAVAVVFDAGLNNGGCIDAIWDRIFGPRTIGQRVNHILRSTPLIDGHNDLAIYIREHYNNHIYYDNFSQPFSQGGLLGHVDIPRLREGQNGGAFWSVFTPCPDNGSDFSDENYAASVQLTLQQIDLVARLKNAYPEEFAADGDSVHSLASFYKGRLISPLGVEGLHQIGNSVANLRRYYDMGVRYATLTHNCHNAFADAALLENPFRVAEPFWHGISPAGKKLVHEMNRIGMIVDLSHTSEETMVDVLGGNDWEGSKAPIIFSHSSAFSICQHPRNVKDHVLDLVKKTDSVVMVNFSPSFISCTPPKTPHDVPELEPENSTLEQVVRHVKYIGDRIGYDHVGFGSDFDGIPTTPEGLDDVSKYPSLVGKLLEEGVSDADARKIVGGNVLRVWRKAEAMAHELQRQGFPVLEDNLKGLLE